MQAFVTGTIAIQKDNISFLVDSSVSKSNIPLHSWTVYSLSHSTPQPAIHTQSVSLLPLLNVCLEIQIEITAIRSELFCCTGGLVKGTCSKRMFPFTKEYLNWLLKIFTLCRTFSSNNIYKKKNYVSISSSYNSTLIILTGFSTSQIRICCSVLV
jgi:hypothetical protein